MYQYFFTIFLITIIAIRFFLYFCPISAPTIGKLRLHHYMFGIAGILLGLLIHSILIFSIGLGLFVDELTYILIDGKTHQDNYSKTSILGTLLFIILIFILKDYLLSILNF